MAETVDPVDGIIDAALPHVAFDGWTEKTFLGASADSGVDPVVARGLFPRGAVDVALAFHRRADRRMAEALGDADMGAMRHGEKVALAIRIRLGEVEGHKEAVRRAAALFALPRHAADGLAAMWGTADLIWRTLGDTSEDINWYTKRATLSVVYSSAALYWLGDGSPGHADTMAFIDRRIDDVMRFEKFKAAARSNPAVQPLLALTDRLARRIKRPGRNRFAGMPGSLGRQG